jgi:hypothetical protein
VNFPVYDSSFPFTFFGAGAVSLLRASQIPRYGYPHKILIGATTIGFCVVSSQNMRGPRPAQSRLSLRLPAFITILVFLFPTFLDFPILSVDFFSHPPRYPRNFTVYDAVLYNGESHLLYLRLRLLSAYVDHFILAYSCMTFQGLPNENLTFEPLEFEISRYSEKLTVFTRCESGEQSGWLRESNLREFLLASIATFQPRDIDLVINCDADEIPTPAGLEWVYKYPPTNFYKFRGYYFMYTFKWWMPCDVWVKASITRWKGVTSLQYFRREGKHRTPGYTLLHCTYCFPEIAGVRKKLTSFCHSEFGKEPFTNPNYIFAAAKCGKGMIPPRTHLLEKWPGDIDDLIPFRHPELDFLRDDFGFRNTSETSLPEIHRFLRFLNCTKPEAFQ